MSKLVHDLAEVLNRHSVESASNTPDFILAQYLTACLDAFNTGVLLREKWYGHHHGPGSRTWLTKEDDRIVAKSALRDDLVRSSEA